MHRQPPLLSVTAALVAIALLACAMPVPAAEFQADIRISQPGQPMTGKIYVQDARYRLDLGLEDESILVIVDQDANLSRIYNVSDKEYREMATDDRMSQVMDPFQGLKYSIANGETRATGSETVAGYECDKSIVSMQGQDIMTQWVAGKLQFPLKMVNLLKEDMFVELSNSQETAVDDGLFALQSGYTKWIHPSKRPIPMPEWAKDLASQPVLTLPFEKEMAAGDIARIKVQPAKSVWLKAVASGEADAKAKAIPFLKGKPVKNPDMLSNFAQRGVICTRNHETTREADEIVVHLEEGSCTVTGKYYDMHEKIVSAGEEFRVPLPTDDNIEDIRFVNLLAEESVVSWTYSEAGQEISEDKIGPAEYRTVTLKEENEVNRKSLSAVGDEIVITVEKGRILVKLGQWDTFKFE